MIRAAVVDDMKEDLDRIKSYLERYGREHEESAMQIRTYHSSIDFLEEYKSDADLIFLDIEMPGTSGMEAAREIRAKDMNVAIIFITNMAQYAVEGYEVDAVDYILKPVRYEIFAQKLEKAFRFLKQHRTSALTVNTNGGTVRIAAGDVLYIEKDRNYLVYHTTRGDFRERGTLHSVADRLGTLHFAGASNGCLINMDHVDMIQNDTVTVRGEKVPLSRRMKKVFIQSYMEYIGG